MKKYYVVLSRSNTIVALRVRFLSKKYYSHASVSFTLGLDPFYSFGRKNPYLVLPAGFISESMTTGYFGAYPKTKVIVLEGEINDRDYQLVQENLEYFEENKKKFKYDILGLTMGYFGIPNNHRWHYTCSGFIAYIFRDVLNFNKPYSLVEPEDFLRLGLKIIYEGTAGEYDYEKL